MSYYLQITTKCNMTCEHCGFSCTMRGKHGDYHDILDAMRFINEHDDHLTIGGGEPTLHPRFFDILKRALWTFEYVWFATNGSQTESMRRIYNILQMQDFEEIECTCTEEDREELSDCYCYENGDPDYTIQVDNEDHLGVTVSSDPFHDPIDPWVMDTWRRQGWELRDVYSNDPSKITNQGRAKKNNLGGENTCFGSNKIIKPDGKIRLCACPRSPVIGSVRMGIDEDWQKALDNSDDYQNSECYRSLKPNEKPKRRPHAQ